MDAVTGNTPRYSWRSAVVGRPGALECNWPPAPRPQQPRRHAYRTVYAVQIGMRIYVLHAFQKKSKHGVRTSKSDVDLIRLRYRQASEIEEGA